MKRLIQALPVLGAALAFNACALPPERDGLMPEGQDAIASLLAACETPLTDATLAAAADTPEQRNFVRRIHALEGALTRRPLTPGNRASLLIDGPATHSAQVAAIARARHHVHLLTYIITDDEIGQRYLKVLTERARAGVKVRMMFDAFGGREAGAAYREKLKAAGVEIHEYGPINPVEDPEQWRVTRRNHRKILVVDGKVAFTGGINISDEYKRASADFIGAGGSGGGSSSSAGAGSKEQREDVDGDGVAHGAWRDTHIRIDGPAVAEFQKLFFETWEAEQGRIPADRGYWPKLAPAGGELVRAVTQNGQDLSQQVLGPLGGLLLGVGPDRDEDPAYAIYGSYLAAISEARSRVWITQAYFIPNSEFLDVLKRAAGRGVDVRVLVAGQSDIGLLLPASRRLYQTLLDAGVRIFEYTGPVLHAKTAVVDGVWATVGSSNLDYRSFIHNDEANAIIVGQRFAKDMERMFLHDLGTTREILAPEWERRPFTQKVREQLTRLVQYWI